MTRLVVVVVVLFLLTCNNSCHGWSSRSCLFSTTGGQCDRRRHHRLNQNHRAAGHTPWKTSSHLEIPLQEGKQNVVVQAQGTCSSLTDDPSPNRSIDPAPFHPFSAALRSTVATVLMMAMIMVTTFLAQPAIADSPPAISTEQMLKQSLKPATEDRPQIPLPTNYNTNPKEGNNAVQGMVYLANPSSNSIAPTDTLVLQVLAIDQTNIGGSDSGSDGGKESKTLTLSPTADVLAGAKIPVSKIPNFPFRFQLTESNYASSQQGNWIEALSNKDLLLRATICPDTSSKIPCNDTNEQTYEALGIAKLLTFGQQPQASQQQGQAETTISKIRAPVSLPLNLVK